MPEFKYKMTVIMPSYNNGRYIEQAIQSVLMQERNFSLQFIITDDASTDMSVEVIKKYEEMYPQIIQGIYSKKNCGLLQNYLKAVEIMQGEYFCVLDPDDYYTDRLRLKRAVEFLENNTEYTIYSENAKAIHEDGTLEKRYYPNMEEGTIIDSAFDDYLNSKAYFCNTPGGTFRNIIFSKGIPKKLKDIAGSGAYGEMPFRADAFRTIMHLHEGKARFVNNFIAEYRVREDGLYQKKSDLEKMLMAMWGNYNYNKYFDNQFIDKYYPIINKCVEKFIQELLLQTKLQTMQDILDEEKMKLFHIVMNWLVANKQFAKNKNHRIPFDLKKFTDMKNKKVFFWGTGSGAIQMMENYHIDLKDIDVIVDGDKGKHGKEFLGKTIQSPMKIKEEVSGEFYVLILSSYHEEIIKDIREKQLCSDDAIIDMFEYDG